MNLGFPSRFLKKLSIYQQIRNGQGISKHKDLWKYEAAFLKEAYGKKHQHLNSFLAEKDQAFKWIKKNYPNFTKYREILGNLFWRKYIEIIEKKEFRNENNDPKKIELNILDSTKYNVKNNDILEKYYIRPTQEGLLVGEIISEIENESYLLKYWNKYRYSFILDLFWLLIFTGIGKLFFDDYLKTIFKNLSEKNFLNSDLRYNLFVFVLIFIFWPLLTLIYRKIYICIENCSNNN